MIKFFEKFIVNSEDFFENSNISIIEFLIKDEILKIQKNEKNQEEANQITDFLFKFFPNEIIKIKINSERILNDLDNLKNEINDFFEPQTDLFENFETPPANSLILLSFFFEKDIKIKNLNLFFDFLKSKLKSPCSISKKILIIKEINSENNSFEFEKIFSNFLNFLTKNELKFKIFKEKFGISEKKQIIEDFLTKNELNFAKEITKNKIIQILLSKSLFFIEGEFLKFSLSGQNQEGFLKEILSLNRDYKIFEIFKILLKNDSKELTKEFLFSIEKLIEAEEQPILIIRSLMHFLFEHKAFFEKKLGLENFIQILEMTFEFEIFIKNSEFYSMNEISKKSWQKKFFIEFLRFFDL